MLAVACALLAALMYAVASVAQQRSAAAQPEEHSLRLGLLTRLAQNRTWLLGVAADVAGYVLQFVALARGTLVVVQPLLVCGLLFALPIEARAGADRMRRSDWAAALAVVVGLAAFLGLAEPQAGHQDVPVRTWVAVLLPSAGLCGLLLVAAVGRRRHARHRAVLLSATAGIAYGVAAALTKSVAHQIGAGVVTPLEHWQVYLLAAVGVGGMLVAQSAFQAGSLDASLPTMTVLDPLVSIVIGAAAFGEALAVSAARTSIEVVALAVMSTGVVGLARTPAMHRLREPPHAPQPT